MRTPVVDSRQVYLYALNPSDGSAWRAFVERETGPGFVDLSGHGVKDAVERIRADGIDILVDLMGFTGGSFAINRDAIVAARPAALQLCMLGYPSTCGSDFVDYTVADRIIAPPEVRADFVEKLLYVPYSYQVSHRAPNQQISDLQSRRFSHGRGWMPGQQPEARGRHRRWGKHSAAPRRVWAAAGAGAGVLLLQFTLQD